MTLFYLNLVNIYKFYLSGMTFYFLFQENLLLLIEVLFMITALTFLSDKLNIWFLSWLSLLTELLVILIFVFYNGWLHFIPHTLCNMLSDSGYIASWPSAVCWNRVFWLIFVSLTFSWSLLLVLLGFSGYTFSLMKERAYLHQLLLLGGESRDTGPPAFGYDNMLKSVFLQSWGL